MRRIFVGDLHGCAAEFAEILRQTDFRSGRDRLLLTGDAFSRGPDPLGVWQLIQDTGASMVLGNHDARLLEQLRALQKEQPPAVQGADQQRLLDRVQPIGPELLAWLEALPLYIREEDFLLVHAGINPEKGLCGTTRDEFLAIRTWPPSGVEGPRWHDHYTPDARLLVFGHDALGGLVLKRESGGRLFLLGLDSGCVYGNALSAYIAEEDRLLQVPSRQPPQY